MDNGCLDKVDFFAMAEKGAGLSLLDKMLVQDLLELSGFQNDEKRFLLIPFLIQLLQSLRSGSLCLTADCRRLFQKMYWLHEFFPDGEKEFRRSFYEPFLHNLRAGVYAPLIGEGDSEAVAVVYRKNSNDSPVFWFRRYFIHERALEKLICNRLRHNVPLPVKTELLIHNLQTAIQKAKVPSMGVRQLEALDKALSCSFSIISGGPGTGKTTLIVNILRAFFYAGFKPADFLLCAPTGRAAQRMTDSIRAGIIRMGEADPLFSSLELLSADTIHKALAYSRFENRFTRNKENPFSARLIIVDEVSMVDLVLMRNFFEACLDKAHVVLVGDRNQLPPVEAGAVFASVFPGHGNGENIFSRNITELVENHRSEKSIRELADSCLQGRLPVKMERIIFDRRDALSGAFDGFGDKCLWLEMPEQLSRKEQLANLLLLRKWLLDDFYQKFISEKKPQGFRALVRNLENYFLSASFMKGSDSICQDQNVCRLLCLIFESLHGFRILSPNRDGFLGCAEINRQICRRFYGVKYSSVKDDEIFSGAVIMIQKNDYGLNLFNGDTGVIIRVEGDKFMAFFERGNGFVAFDPEALPSFAHAFAMTVHKSQGSEFENLLLLLPPHLPNPILTRNLVYTAVTRAKKNLVMCVSRAVLGYALKNVTERESGINW
jgi:exodeoxyribonuclease V alpha subunit